MIKLLEKLMAEDFKDQFEPTSEEELGKRKFEPLNKIEDIDFSSFRKKVKSKEGIVLLGVGGDPEDWINGVVDIWDVEGIYSGHPNDAFESSYLLKTTGGRTDLALVFKKGAKLDMGKMAMWRLSFGDCSWISDYIVNYRNQH